MHITSFTFRKSNIRKTVDMPHFSHTQSNIQQLYGQPGKIILNQRCCQSCIAFITYEFNISYSIDKHSALFRQTNHMRANIVSNFQSFDHSCVVQCFYSKKYKSKTKKTFVSIWLQKHIEKSSKVKTHLFILLLTYKLTYMRKKAFLFFNWIECWFVWLNISKFFD